MTIQEIPLTADNQQFSIVLGGVTWRISIIWRDPYWIMDLQNDRGEPVIYQKQFQIWQIARPGVQEKPLPDQQN